MCDKQFYQRDNTEFVCYVKKRKVQHMTVWHSSSCEDFTFFCFWNVTLHLVFLLEICSPEEKKRKKKNDLKKTKNKGRCYLHIENFYYL